MTCTASAPSVRARAAQAAAQAQYPALDLSTVASVGDIDKRIRAADRDDEIRVPLLSPFYVAAIRKRYQLKPREAEAKVVEASHYLRAALLPGYLAWDDPIRAASERKARGGTR